MKNLSVKECKKVIGTNFTNFINLETLIMDKFDSGIDKKVDLYKKPF
jgi:hypothetical protein